MRASPGNLRVLTVRGINIYVHFSLILLLFYVVFVSAARFQLVAESAGVGIEELRWGAGIWSLLFALGLFVSVVLHELGHSFVAQAFGVRVRGITLMMLGGISEMETIPERPYAEFKLAIVGPLVSLGLAAIFGWIRSVTASPDLYFYSYWLGSANLVLAVFNLIPAYPLDGGRALRSFLAARRGRVRGTETAVRISRGIAWALGIFGLLQFNLLLVLIAWVIHASAERELFVMLSQSVLKTIQVEEVLRRTRVLDGSWTVAQAVDEMMRTRSTVLPVDLASSKTDVHAGVVSLEHLTRIRRSVWQAATLKDVVDPAPKVLELGSSLAEALPEITLTLAQALPVKEGDRLVGVVRYRDVSELLMFRQLESGGGGPPEGRPKGDVDRAA